MKSEYKFQMYAKFVEEYDGIDNGVNQFDGEPRYHITSTASARVGRCNPRWNEDQESVYYQDFFALKVKICSPKKF
jgi:uncharacterized UPF0160 family protein